MRERPILFSGSMVRAILAGTKTQTRRMVKPQPDAWTGGTTLVKFTPDDQRLGRLGVVIRCPYGQPGDRLWVREAWAAHASEDHLPPRDCNRAIRFYETEHGGQRGLNPRIGKKRPSMFMPRWHSRITLEVTGVRVERLQDISVADCIAEGIARGGPENPDGIEQREYRALWESINGPGSWDANPFVWVLEFPPACRAARVDPAPAIVCALSNTGRAN